MDIQNGESSILEGELREAKRDVELDRERLEADERNVRKIEDELHKKEFDIIVNTREKHVKGPKISFDQLVILGFEAVPTGTSIEFSITYRNGPHDKPQGTVAPDQSVELKEHMIFNVTCTDKS